MRIEMSKEEWVLIAMAAERGLNDDSGGRSISTNEEARDGNVEAIEQVDAVTKLNRRLGFVA